LFIYLFKIHQKKQKINPNSSTQSTQSTHFFFFFFSNRGLVSNKKIKKAKVTISMIPPPINYFAQNIFFLPSCHLFPNFTGYFLFLFYCFNSSISKSFFQKRK